MYRLLLLTLLLFSSLTTKMHANDSALDPCSLLYVHIGPQLPSYLDVNIAQARLFNPKIPIYLIGNSSALSAYDNTKHAVILVPIESLTLSNYHENFIHGAKTQGFWRYALERFLYIDDFIQQYGLTNIFHIENDVMIYINLEEKLPTFEQFYSGMIGAVFDCEARCIPSFVYFSNALPSKKLAEFISVNGLEGSNDMTLLNQFKESYYKKFSDHLPILIPAYAKDRPLTNLLKKTAKNALPYSNHLEEFQVIFDGAAIGQFLGGIDPIHGRSEPGFVNELTVFYTPYFTYIWKRDKNKRLVPFISYKGISYPIANLHVHSKNLKSFYSLNKNPIRIPSSFWALAPLK